MQWPIFLLRANAIYLSVPNFNTIGSVPQTRKRGFPPGAGRKGIFFHFFFLKHKLQQLYMAKFNFSRVMQLNYKCVKPHSVISLSSLTWENHIVLLLEKKFRPCVFGWTIRHVYYYSSIHTRSESKAQYYLSTVSN